MTEYSLYFEFQAPNSGKFYEYQLDSKTDMLSFKLEQSDNNFTEKIKLDHKIAYKLFKDGIKTFEGIRIQPKNETQLNCNYFIRLQISHNFHNKAISTKDKYYYDQISKYLNDFNNNIPSRLSIPLSEFTFTNWLPTSKGNPDLDTTILVSWKYSIFTSDNDKNKYLQYRSSSCNKISLTSFNYQTAIVDTLTLDRQNRDSLFFKTLKFLNSFKYDTTIFKKPIKDQQQFELSYFSPAIAIEGYLGSLTLAKTKKDSKAVVDFFNKSILINRHLE